MMASLMQGGDRINADAAKFLHDRLSEYPEQKVIDALNRCLAELKFFPSFSEIIDRIDDGRPQVEEAWALCPKNDSSAAYINEEIMEAWGVANSIINDTGDKVAARMAFKEIYERTVSENRSKGIKPKWWLTRAYGLGSEIANEAALRVAVEKNRLPESSAIALLPSYTPSKNNLPQIELKESLSENSARIKNIVSTIFK